MDPQSRPLHPVRPTLAACLIAAGLAACGGGGPPAAATAPGAAASGSAQQVEARVGDATVYVTAFQTSSIPAGVAREYGIERRDDRVMVRVSARRDEGGTTRSAPVTVSGTVTGLRGQAHALSFAEATANGLVDQVATVPVELPDTLRFDLQVATPAGARERVQLTRDVLAR